MIRKLVGEEVKGVVVLGNNHLLQSVGSINEEYLTTCENNDHLSKVKDVSTDNSCSLSQHVDISPAESFRETRIQYLKDINAVVLKKSRHCVDNDFNRTADAFIAIEHSNFNADGASFSCIIDALEEESRINRLRKESLYQEAADIRHAYDMLRLSAKESLCEKDKGSKFEAILNSPDPFCLPSHFINESYSILSSKLNGGAFCCLFYFFMELEKASATKLFGSNVELGLLFDRFGSECNIDTTDFELKNNLFPEPFHRPSVFESVSVLERYSLELLNDNFKLASCASLFLFRSKLWLTCCRCSRVLSTTYEDRMILNLDYVGVSPDSPRSLSDIIRYGS